MQTVTLQAEDFKTIHNTLCDLRSLQQQITGVVNSKIEDRVHAIIRSFEAGLADAYRQDEAVFDSKMDYFREFQDQNDFAAIWSMYELNVGCFDEPHPFPSDAFVCYSEHWGEHKGHVPVMGPTWGDVYRAADCAIRNSGDLHHIFIEGFSVKGNELHLQTGS